MSHVKANPFMGARADAISSRARARARARADGLRDKGITL